MNKKQEKALFGNVLPEAKNDLAEQIFQNIRSQREAIGALIESTQCIEKMLDDVKLNLWSDVTRRFYTTYENGKRQILSAVQQNTWEDVREAWEVNE